MTTNVKYRARERQSKRESKRQASEAQQEKGRQISTEKERYLYFCILFFTPSYNTLVVQLYNSCTISIIHELYNINWYKIA